MEIRYSRDFIKHYRTRIRPHKELVAKLTVRVQILLTNPLDPVLRSHRLKGRKKSYSAFSLTGDIRVIFIMDKAVLTLFDIGTHNQVY